MKAKLILASLFLSMAGLSAQTYQVPVSEQDEPMMKGKFEPTWTERISRTGRRTRVKNAS